VKSQFPHTDKMIWLNDRLADVECDEYYPVDLLEELLMTTYDATRRMGETFFRGENFNFDQNWEEFLSPYVFLLMLNKIFEPLIKVHGPDGLFRILEGNGHVKKYKDVEYPVQVYIEALLADHGMKNNLSEIFAIIRSSD
jgi:hypothetical protein